MAESCREQRVKVEEEVVQRVDSYAKEQRERCENEACNPWLLCLNQVVCWLYWVTVKLTVWITIIVVRWVYQVVCVAVSLVLGLLALIFTFNLEILIRALQDLWELVKDVVYFALGAIILYGNYAVDTILTLINVKNKSRKLTKEEIAVLRPIFGDSIIYGLIDVNEDRLGIMGPPFVLSGEGATTVGYSIYFRTYSLVTLVHECVHIWQFQFGGTHYIGQSVIYQGINLFGGEDPYDWLAKIGSDENGWYLMDSVEAQAEFIEDIFNFGSFIANDGSIDTENGAFFRESDDGENEFMYGLDANGEETRDPAEGAEDFTRAANAAWNILRTG